MKNCYSSDEVVQQNGAANPPNAVPSIAVPDSDNDDEVYIYPPEEPTNSHKQRR